MDILRTFFTLLLCLVGVNLKSQPMEFVHSTLYLSDYSLTGKIKSFTETEYKIEDRYGRQYESRRLTCYFDTSGHVTEERQINSNGNVALRIVHNYENNEPSEDIMYGTDGSVESLQTYEYKPNETKIKMNAVVKYIKRFNGKQLSSIERYSEGNLESILRYTYTKGNLSTCQLFSNKGQLETIYKYKFASNNKLMEEEEITVAENLRHLTKFDYNSNGDVVRETSRYLSDPDSIVIEYVYAYDDHNNWIEKKETMNGRLFAITARNIAYY